MEVSIDMDDSSELATNVPYREAIGCLMYLMVGMRPDIAFAVSRMAQYVESPTGLQWKAVKHIMRYIKHTSDYGLEFGRSGNFDFMCFCDSDWGGETATRKSTSGYTFCLAGGAISWSSKNAILEGEITLKYCSTTEMVADMITKALGKVKLDEFVKLVGLVRTSG
jgi:hypothetical protein